MKKTIDEEIEDITLEVEQRLDDLCVEVHGKAAACIARKYPDSDPIIINMLMDMYIHAYTQSVLDQKEEFEKELLRFAQ